MNFAQVLRVLRISSGNWYLKIYNSTRLFKLPTSKARVPLKRFPGRSSISENVVISKICCGKIPSSTANGNKLVGLYCKYLQIDKISCLRRNGSFYFDWDHCGWDVYYGNWSGPPNWLSYKMRVSNLLVCKKVNKIKIIVYHRSQVIVALRKAAKLNRHFPFELIGGKVKKLCNLKCWTKNQGKSQKKLFAAILNSPRFGRLKPMSNSNLPLNLLSGVTMENWFLPR